MTVIEPNIPDKARMPIGRAAELLGISRDTLRIHTTNGLIKCGFNRANKRKFYTGAELKRYWRSYC